MIISFQEKNYMVLNLDRDWLDKFKNRTDRGDKSNVYYGIGKVLDAGSLFAQFTGEEKVAERAKYIMDQLRNSRDSDGYLGFWNVETNNHQNVVNWILHEQEYINLALVRNYRVTGNPQTLADARIMADYIMRMFPPNDRGEHIIPSGTSIAGITESFVELYRVSGEEKYLEFAKTLQYEPHWYYLKPFDAWEKNIAQARYHVYVMLSHMYPDLELYRLIGGDDYTHAPMFCDGVRIVSLGPPMVDQATIDVLSGTEWVRVYEGAVLDQQWDTKMFTAKNISQARVSLHLSGNFGTTWDFYELEFHHLSLPRYGSRILIQ